ncbi:MAG: hypothetical protein V4722_27750 [Bacteroidota bacterium]
MELVLEISDEKLKELDIHESRIAFDELQAKMAAEKAKSFLKKNNLDPIVTKAEEDDEIEIFNMVREEQRAYYNAAKDA